MSRTSMSGLAHELYTSPQTERILEYATKVYRTACFRQRGRVVEVCIEALRLTFKLTDAELKEVRKVRDDLGAGPPHSPSSPHSSCALRSSAVPAKPNAAFASSAGRDGESSSRLTRTPSASSSNPALRNGTSRASRTWPHSAGTRSRTRTARSTRRWPASGTLHEGSVLSSVGSDVDSLSRHAQMCPECLPHSPWPAVCTVHVFPMYKLS